MEAGATVVAVAMVATAYSCFRYVKLRKTEVMRTRENIQIKIHES
jgi:hypothetical protein